MITVLPHHPIHINTPSISAAATITTRISRTVRHDIQIFPNSARPHSSDKAAVSVKAPVPTGATEAAVEFSVSDAGGIGALPSGEREPSVTLAFPASESLSVCAPPATVTSTSEAFSPTASEVGFSFPSSRGGSATPSVVRLLGLKTGTESGPRDSFCFATLHRSVAETAATALCPEGFTSVAAATSLCFDKYSTTFRAEAASAIQEPISSSVCE